LATLALLAAERKPNWFSIAFVCSGNRFRSPLAEAFVRSLTRGLRVEVESFGTLELGSVPALAEARQIAAYCGVDVSKHTTRLVGARSLADIDLLLGFEEGHARRAVVDAGAPLERAFSLREIVSLLEGEQPERSGDVVEDGRLAVRLAAEKRATLANAAKIEPIRDPFGKSWRVHTSVASEVRALSIALVERLFGVTDASALPHVPNKLARPRR
jgi:protein-tyrosine-phosphatase